jgi:hypothetical protein
MVGRVHVVDGGLVETMRTLLSTSASSQSTTFDAVGIERPSMQFQ